MKFKFNLEKVLQHRKVLENLAQIAYQEALAKAKAEEAILARFENEIVEARKRAYELQSKGMDQALAQLQDIERFIKLQGLRIEAQKAKIQKANKLVEEKREILRTCATESKIMEKLKEKKRLEYIKEMNRVEQLEMDEMSLMRLRVREKG